MNPVAGPQRYKSAVAYGSGSLHPINSPGNASNWKLKLALAILGALICGGVAGTVLGTTASMAAALGAIAGLSTPTIFALLGKLVVFSVRLAIWLLKVAFVIALIAGVIYVAVTFAGK
jgi:hypothetical protein